MLDDSNPPVTGLPNQCFLCFCITNSRMNFIGPERQGWVWGKNLNPNYKSLLFGTIGCRGMVSGMLLVNCYLRGTWPQWGDTCGASLWVRMGQCEKHSRVVSWQWRVKQRRMKRKLKQKQSSLWKSWLLARNKPWIADSSQGMDAETENCSIIGVCPETRMNTGHPFHF